MLKNRLRECRRAAGLTLYQLAELSGIPVSTIGDIEQGAEPRVLTALLLARSLNATVEYLWPLPKRR